MRESDAVQLLALIFYTPRAKRASFSSNFSDFKRESEKVGEREYDVKLSEFLPASVTRADNSLMQKIEPSAEFFCAIYVIKVSAHERVCVREFFEPQARPGKDQTMKNITSAIENYS